MDELTPKSNLEIVISIKKEMDGSIIFSSRGHSVPGVCAAVSTLMAGMYAFLVNNLKENAVVGWKGPKSGVFDLTCPYQFRREADYLVFNLKLLAENYPIYTRIVELT